MFSKASSSRGLQSATLFFTLAGFILCLLVVLSVPTISSISFTSLSTTNTGTTHDTGVFGVCYRTGVGSGFRFPRSGVANPSYRDPNPTNMCPRLGLGWWSSFSPLWNVAPYTEIAPRGSTRALVVNVLTVAFSALSLVLAALVFAAWTNGPKACTLALLFSTLFAWIAFAIDIAFSVQVRNRLNATDETVRVKLGNANWLALAGAISLTIAFILAVIADRRVSAERKRQVAVESNAKSEHTAPSSARTSDV